MISNIEWMTSLDAASIAGDTAESFDFAASTYCDGTLGTGGNVVAVSNKSGGAYRITFNGAAPTAASAAIEDDEGGFYLSGGTQHFVFKPGTKITEVQIKPLTDAWGITVVTLANHYGS